MISRNPSIDAHGFDQGPMPTTSGFAKEGLLCILAKESHDLGSFGRLLAQGSHDLGGLGSFCRPRDKQ